MNQLIFATHNPNKVAEIKKILSQQQILSLADIDYQEEIPETGDTLFENALIKVKAIYKATGKACLADDTGLEVMALKGAPGVYSARYAGENADADANIEKLLHELNGQSYRDARFRTVIAFMNDFGQYRFFEGEVRGAITEEKRGVAGFGYDPVFVPEGYDQTFAEMPASEKNRISHRSRALSEFEAYFKLVETA